MANVDEASDAIGPMAQVGRVHAPEPFDEADSKLSFCTPSVERRSHHLHVLEGSSDDWRGRLAFRDYLRTHPDAARECAALKIALAEQFGSDPNERDAYRGGKHEFVQRITALALER